MMNLNSRKVARFIVIFYVIGLAGFMIPPTQEFFIMLTKWALLLNFLLLLWFHESRLGAPAIIIFSIIALSGYAVEVAGVESGMIFGTYTYGSGLGIKLFETPLLIGINWLMLSYCFASVLQPLKAALPLKALLASAGMVAYDLVMEQTAPLLDLWSWEDGIVPLRNYLAWFVIALIFQSMLVFSKINMKNPLAKVLLISQFAFFALLLAYKYIAL
jgi:putative membrane protein